MSESFFMTNISPQLPNFNRGAWKEIEIQIREWVKEYDTVAIITGAIHEKYPKKITKWVGDSLPVPNYFYKIFIDIQIIFSIKITFQCHSSTNDSQSN